MRYKNLLLMVVVLVFVVVPSVGRGQVTLVDRQETCRTLCPDITNASCVKEKCGAIFNPDPRGATICDAGNKCPTGYLCSADYSMYSNYAIMSGVKSNEVVKKGVCISTAVKYTTRGGCIDTKCPSIDMCVVARGNPYTSGLCVLAGGISGANACKENEELKDGSCGCKKDYHYSVDKKCVSKDDARKICKARENTVFDEVAVYCICKDGYNMDPGNKKCVKDKNTAECEEAESALNKVEGSIKSIDNEIVRFNNISNKRKKNREATFPPGAWSERFGRYELERRELEADLEAIKSVKLRAAKDSFSKNDCVTAKGIADDAQMELDKTNYARFRAESCAMQSTPTVKKMGYRLISANLELPEGCDPRWVTMTVKKRTWTWYGPVPVVTTKVLATVPLAEHQDIAGALGEIKIDESLKELGVDQYYGRGGLIFAYWSSTWIYGEVETKRSLR